MYQRRGFDKKHVLGTVLKYMFHNFHFQSQQAKFKNLIIFGANFDKKVNFQAKI